MRELVSFGNCQLDDFGVVTDVKRSFAGTELVTEAVSGRDGDVLKGARLTQPEVSLMLVSHRVSAEAKRELVRLLSPALLVTEPQRLEFSTDGGLYYMAVLAERPDFHEYVTAGTLRLAFFIDGPFMRGRTVTETMTSTKSITVSGTYPTPLRVYGTATPSNGYFGIRIDSQERMLVAMSGSGSVDIDSEARTCKVGGVTKQITLASDWIVMDAGTHSLAFDPGSGDLTLEWTERWL